MPSLAIFWNGLALRYSFARGSSKVPEHLRGVFNPLILGVFAVRAPHHRRAIIAPENLPKRDIALAREGHLSLSVGDRSGIAKRTNERRPSGGRPSTLWYVAKLVSLRTDFKRDGIVRITLF